MRDQVSCRAHHLDEVVRRHVGRHTDRDSRCPVDEQIGKSRRQHLRLCQLVVIVRHEVDHVFVEVFGHGHRGRGKARFGVARRSRPIIQGAEIAMPIDQRNTQDEALGKPHHRVVNGRIAVRMQLAHDFAGDAGRLDVPAVGAQPHLGHLVQDATLNRLETITRVGKGS